MAFRTGHIKRAGASDGLSIPLSSSNPALAAVPPAILIPAGATQAQTIAQTVATTTTTAVTITATYNGLSRATTLTITP